MHASMKGKTQHLFSIRYLFNHSSLKNNISCHKSSSGILRTFEDLLRIIIEQSQHFEYAIDSAISRYFNDRAIKRSIDRSAVFGQDDYRASPSAAFVGLFASRSGMTGPETFGRTYALSVRFISGGSRIRGKRSSPRVPCPRDRVMSSLEITRGGVFSCVRSSTGKESFIVRRMHRRVEK